MSSSSSSSPLLKTVLLERVVHFTSKDLYSTGKLAFVCQSFSETLQFYCLSVWQRLFTAYLISTNRDPTNPSCLYNLLCDEIISNKLSTLVSPVCNCGTGPNDSSLLGSSALLCAAATGSVPIVKELVARGASILEEANLFGENALHSAARGGHLDLVKYIVAEHLINLDPKERGAFLNKVTNHGHSPLYLSIMANHTKTALFFLSCSDIDLRAGGKTNPLSNIHAAARRDNNEILSRILVLAPESINQCQIDGKLPIETAVACNSLRCFKEIVVWCRDLDLKDSKNDDKTSSKSRIDDLRSSESLLALLEGKPKMKDFLMADDLSTI